MFLRRKLLRISSRHAKKNQKFSFFLLFVAVVTTALKLMETKDEQVHRRLQNVMFSEDRNIPLLLLAGTLGSGIELVESTLNNHHNIYCHQLSTVFFSTLSLMDNMTQSLLVEAGVHSEVRNSGSAAFLLILLSAHMRKAPSKNLSQWCFHDPSFKHYGPSFPSLFPRSKLLLLVRDGRVLSYKMAHSQIDDYFYQHLKKWNGEMTQLLAACKNFGASACLVLFYEDLRAQPQQESNKVYDFLGLPRAPCALKPGSKQVLRWLRKMPHSLKMLMYQTAPLLELMRYDSNYTFTFA